MSNPLALHKACEKGDLEKVTALLDVGACVDSNKRGYNKMTPLHWTSIQGHKEIAELLIKHGASLDTQSDDGMTALNYVSFWGHQELAELFIKHGASLDIQGNDGMTPLHWAVYKRYKEIAALLIKHGASLDAQDSKQKTPIHLAALQGYGEIIRLLVGKNFFSSSLQSSLQARCIATLLMNLDKVDKMKLIPQLARLLTTNDAIAPIIADQVPLKLQRSFVNLLQEQKAEQAPEARQAINVLLSAHVARHLKKIQYVLEMKDDEYKTARDITSKVIDRRIVELLDHLTQAQHFDELDQELQQSIIATIKDKLLLEPAQS